MLDFCLEYGNLVDGGLAGSLAGVSQNYLDQAFENDKCCNSDTDFQRDGTFPLVSSKLNWTRRRKHAKEVTRC